MGLVSGGCGFESSLFPSMSPNFLSHPYASHCNRIGVCLIFRASSSMDSNGKSFSALLMLTHLSLRSKGGRPSSSLCEKAWQLLSEWEKLNCSIFPPSLCHLPQASGYAQEPRVARKVSWISARFEILEEPLPQPLSLGVPLPQPLPLDSAGSDVSYHPAVLEAPQVPL